MVRAEDVQVAAPFGPKSESRCRGITHALTWHCNSTRRVMRPVAIRFDLIPSSKMKKDWQVAHSAVSVVGDGVVAHESQEWEVARKGRGAVPSDTLRSPVPLVTRLQKPLIRCESVVVRSSDIKTANCEVICVSPRR